MDKATGQEKTGRLVAALQRWQEIEIKSVERAAHVMQKTSNPLIRQLMEIIRSDSVQHHRVQQFIIDSLTTQPVQLKPEELGQVWGEIEAHDQAEKEAIELAKQARDECPFFVQKHLLDYLFTDEEKHDALLEGILTQFKKKLYP